MKLLEFIYRKSTRNVAVVSVAIFILFMAIVLPRVSTYTATVTNNAPSPDMSLYYSANELFDIAEEYGEEARTTYVILRFTFDIVWPFVYTLFLITAISFFMRKVADKRILFLSLPLFAIALDYLENIVLSIVMISYPNRAVFFATIASPITILKWLFLGVSFVLLFVMILRLGVQKIRTK